MNLVSLDLSKNHIKEFPPLNEFKYLKRLNLENNNLIEIKNNCINNSLETLNLSFNKIYSL